VRGCLFVLVAAAVVVAIVAWFGASPLASAVATAALQGSGLQADRMTVTATSDPPPKLLLGRADRLDIEATGVRFRTFEAAGLVLHLTDVDVLAHTAKSLDGRVEGATVTTGDGIPTQADVTLTGSAAAADAVIVVDGATVDRVVRATFERQAGVAITRTELVAPDLLRIVTPAATIEGRLVLDASGAVAISTRLGETPILSLDPAFPLQLTAVRVDAGNLRIDGVLDAEALLGR
jgi:hypothetical protein